MSEIKWETPPSKKTGTPRHQEFAAALRERMGEWAVFSKDSSSSTVTQINRGGLSAFTPAGHFEARGTAVSHGRSKVYVRYVGGNK